MKRISRIFISFAKENHDLARNVAKLLFKNKYSVWLSSQQIVPGSNFISEISEALSDCETLILLWSKYANDSLFVKRGWTAAVNLNKRIIPCKLDNSDLPAILSSLQFIEFKGNTIDKDILLNALSKY